MAETIDILCIFVLMFVILIDLGTGPILGIIGALWLTALLVANHVAVLRRRSRHGTGP